ncbi:nuclear transport factor 2 family protein [Pseudonocardia aurantiaca]|uniref:Nuclear transport factor 2 family protein n=1 Tax=Pseudonocardia aurantiaca TaxID=75290 RepID=A0ABW4FQA4_9PSEU
MTTAPMGVGIGADELRRLVDRQQIVEVVFRYCRAVDRCDFDLLRTCYHPDGVDRHTGFTGDIDDYIDWLRTILARYAGTQHLIGQQFVEIDGDVARCESYGIATHWAGPDGDPQYDFTSGFRYIDRMERRCGEWRIAERLATRDWTRSDAGAFRPKEGDGPTGRPSREDPLYHLPGWPPSGNAEPGR